MRDHVATGSQDIGMSLWQTPESLVLLPLPLQYPNSLKCPTGKNKTEGGIYYTCHLAGAYSERQPNRLSARRTQT